MIQIRNATPSDLPSLVRCIDQVARERLFLVNTKGFTLKQTQLFHQELIAAGGVQLVAVDNSLEGDKHVVGWADIKPLEGESFKHVGRFAIGLLPNYRGRGIGSQLMMAILPQAFQSLEKIELDVFSSNDKAIQMYKKFGFVQEGCLRHGRKIDGKTEDVLAFGLLKQEFERARSN